MVFKEFLHSSSKISKKFSYSKEFSAIFTSFI